MSESETTSTAADLEALRALQADASELERIEELLDPHNVFEAIGFVDNEVMHSTSWPASSTRSGTTVSKTCRLRGCCGKPW